MKIDKLQARSQDTEKNNNRKLFLKREKLYLNGIRILREDTNERHTLWGKSTQRETKHLSASALIFKIEPIITFSTKKSVDPVVFTA